jgi:hypothetical protein
MSLLRPAVMPLTTQCTPGTHLFATAAVKDEGAAFEANPPSRTAIRNTNEGLRWTGSRLPT